MLPRFGSELWSGPEPSRTGLRFGPGFGVGAEPDQRSGSGSGVGPNLAEPFRTGSEPQTRWSATQRAEQAHQALYDRMMEYTSPSQYAVDT